MGGICPRVGVVTSRSPDPITRRATTRKSTCVIQFDPNYTRSVPTQLPQGELNNILQYHWTFTVTPTATKTVIGPVTGFMYSWFGDNVTARGNFAAPSVTLTNDCLLTYSHSAQNGPYQPETELAMMTTFTGL